MSKRLNWTVWSVGALGGFWAIYRMWTLGNGHDVKDILTIGILLIVSLVLTETGARS